jgi:hypothetical protein
MEGQVPQTKASSGGTRARSKLAFAAVVVVLATALATAGQAAAAQHAKRAAAAVSHQVVHNPRGHFLGVVPSTLHRNTLHAAAANGTPPLSYHGGPVVHSSKVYAIFWVPSGFYYPANAKAEITQYFKDVGTASWTPGNVYAASTQYCQGVGTGATGCSSAGNKFASYNVSYGSSTTVTTAFPANGCTNYTLGNGSTSKRCLTDAQIQKEVSSVVASKGWSTGLGTQFFVFTPPLVGECFDASESSCYDPEFSAGFCAYHSNISSQTLYAFQPWADITGCVYQSPTVPNNAYPNDDGADPLLNVVSHEHNETITDPLGTAWFDSSGFENGDECAWLSLATQFNGIGDYSQTIASDQYMLQSEWSNRSNSCVEKNTFPQPTGTFTATAGAGAHSENFASSVTDSDDATFRYAWTFGDGASSSSANPSHTYSSAGTKNVTLTVFDAHGDQLHVVKSVAVS